MTDIGETSDGYHTFNELYEHRHALFMAFSAMKGHASWKSRLHDDGSKMDGWFIAGITLPLGMISYHLPDRLWSTCPGIERERGPKWDGHTSADVVDRLKAYAQGKCDLGEAS